MTPTAQVPFVVRGPDRISQAPTLAVSTRVPFVVRGSDTARPIPMGVQAIWVMEELTAKVAPWAVPCTVVWRPLVRFVVRGDTHQTDADRL